MSDILTPESSLLPEILGSQFGDWLFGSDNPERISGLGGDDWLYGFGGDDELDGGSGDDWLEGGSGRDTYLFGWGGGWDVVMAPGWEPDTITFGPGITPADVVAYRGAEDRSDIQYFDDLVLQLKGSTDRIVIANYFSLRPTLTVQFAGGAVWDSDALERKDGFGLGYSVWGGFGDDTLEGGSGADQLNGFEGNDHLHGAGGDDVLWGDGGSDTYYFGRGDGQDTIFYGGGDALVLGRGIFASDLRLQRNDRDLVLRLDGSEDQVTLAPFFGEAPLNVHFADGMVWDGAAIGRVLAGGDDSVFGTEADEALEGGAGDDFLHGAGGQDLLHGGGGNDRLEGGWGRDTYHFGLGDGRDSVHEYEYLGGDEIVLGAGLTVADIALSRTGYNDLVLQVKGRLEQLTVEGHFSVLAVGAIRFADGAFWDAATIERKVNVPWGPALFGTAGTDTLEGGVGADYLYGDDGDDFLHGDAGNDWLLGGAGSDTYYFGRGEGQDEIMDHDTGNTLVFGRDISAADIVATRNGGSLVLQIAGTADQITVYDQFGYQPVLRAIRFADGLQWDVGAIERSVGMGFVYRPASDGDDVIDLGPGDDWISAFGGNDLLHGGAGNDVLEGGAGSDTYYFGWGDGQDTVYDYDGRDVLMFMHGIALPDVSASRSGDDLLLGLKGSADQMRVAGYFGSFAQGLRTIRFFDGGSLDAAAIERMFSSTAPDPVSTAQGDTLYGGLGNEALIGGSGDDLLFGDAGDDWLVGGTGNDTYYFGFGSGSDAISDGSGVDTLRFAADVAPEDIAFGVNLDELVFTLTATGDALRVQRSEANLLGVADIQFARGRTLPVVRGSELDDLLSGSAGRDLFIDGLGVDMLQGGAGDDVYLMRDWATDTFIEDLAEPGGGNQVLLPLWTQPQEIELSWSFSWLELRVQGQGGAIRLGGFDHLDALGARAVERFEFSDGTRLAYDELLARGFVIRGDDYVEGTNLRDTIYGSSGGDVLGGHGGDDILLGGAGADTLHGGDGNDQFLGGAGDDSLLGGAGSDTYFFERTSGHDRVLELASNPGDEDQVVFGSGIRPEDLVVTRNAYDALIVEVSGTDASLHFNAWFLSELPAHVERFVFEGGTVLSDADIEAMANHAPIVVHALDDQLVDEDTSWLFSAPADSFADPDPFDALAYTAALADGSPLPGWLQFTQSPAGPSFLANPTNVQVGRYDIRVTATDLHGLSVSDTFSLSVRNVNDAPVLARALADQSATDELPFAFLVASDAFTDMDASDSLTLSAALANGTALPDWLAFDPATRTFAGTPGTGDIGTLGVRVTATDLTGASAWDEFLLDVQRYPDQVLTGTSAPDLLLGHSGNDTLNGLAGADNMIGKGGDDIYYVDRSSDVVTEAAGEGRDLVHTAVSYTLPANVEDLVLDGMAGISGTGNALDNRITGNSGINTLSGGAGNDTLDGGANRDSMSGGTGDDTYIVDHLSDRVNEGTNAGTDLVRSSVTFTLSANVEYLILTGSAASNGTGNGLANYLLGNDAANVLAGGAANDLLQGAAGTDRLTDTSGNALLDGGAGSDTLTGGSGRELLIGGTGDDALITGSGADIIAFNLGDGRDTVGASGGTDNVVSVGGGVRYEDLALRRSGNNLVLEVSATDSISFTDWYLKSTNRSVGRLQVIAEATPGYDPNAIDPLLLKKVQSFDFSAMVAAFDQAQAEQPSLNRWTVMHKLLDVQLSAADDAALGGDLAYLYGLNGGLAGVGTTAAQEVLAGTQFGTQAQLLRPLDQVQAGATKLV